MCSSPGPIDDTGECEIATAALGLVKERDLFSLTSPRIRCGVLPRLYLMRMVYSVTTLLPRCTLLRSQYLNNGP